MRKKHLQAKSLLFALSMLLVFNVQAQQISSFSIAANPTDCAPINIATSGTLNSLSYVVDSTNFSISGNTLTYNIHFNNPFIILPALGSFNHPDQLNNIPAGNYTVVVRTFLGGSTGSIQSTFNSNMNVVSCCSLNPSIVVSGNVNGLQACAGDSITLTSNTPGANSFAWISGSGAVLSNDSSITLAYSNQGQYTMTLDAGDGSCNQQTSVVLTVDTVATIDLGADTTICDGTTLTLNAQSADPTVMYTWIGTTNNAPTQIVSSAGTYTVQLMNGACSFLDSIMVAVNPSPTVELGNDTLVCFGETATLDVTQTGLTYQWSDGSTGSSLSVDSSATYTVTVTNSFGCSATDDLTFTVNPEIVIGLMDSVVLHFIGDTLMLDAGMWSNYSWNTGDSTQSIIITNIGDYSVTVTDANGCTATEMVTIVLSNTNRVTIEEATIYPNPTFDVLNIEMNKVFDNVEVYNQLGQLVLFENINTQQLNVGTLSSGIYTIHLKDSENELIGIARFIKQ